ncbi:MAG: hypothetical protein ABFS35_15485 [Bacteroidota bacterium]
MNKIKPILGVIILIFFMSVIFGVIYTISIMGDPSSEIKVKIINNSKDNVLIKNTDLLEIDMSKHNAIYKLKYVPLLSCDTILVKRVLFVGLISSEDFNYARASVDSLRLSINGLEQGLSLRNLNNFEQEYINEQEGILYLKLFDQ